MENRKKFYDNELNTDRAEEALHELCTKCTFEEVIWIMRNILYDQVCYYNDTDKGVVYNGQYTELNKEQANRFQQQLSTLLDLFGQSIANKREFNNDYLKSYEFAGPYLRVIEDLKEQIDKLKEELHGN